MHLDVLEKEYGVQAVPPELVKNPLLHAMHPVMATLKPTGNLL